MFILVRLKRPLYLLINSRLTYGLGFQTHEMPTRLRNYFLNEAYSKVKSEINPLLTSFTRLLLTTPDYFE